MTLTYECRMPGFPAVDYQFPDEDTCYLWASEAEDLRGAISEVNDRWENRGARDEHVHERNMDYRRWLALIVGFGQRWVGYVAPDIAVAYDDVRGAIRSEHGSLAVECGAGPSAGGVVASLSGRPAQDFVLPPFRATLDTFRFGAFGMDETDAEAWLNQFALLVAIHGVASIPQDLKTLTEFWEDTLTRRGDVIRPIFRASIPYLVLAACEYKHCSSALSWLHAYHLPDGECLGGTDLPLYDESVLQRVYQAEASLIPRGVPLRQGMTNLFTVRTATVAGLRDWRRWVLRVLAVAEVASLLEGPERRNCCRRLLNRFDEQLAAVAGPTVFTPFLRKLVHELQDMFGEARTVFPGAV